MINWIKKVFKFKDKPEYILTPKGAAFQLYINKKLAGDSVVIEEYDIVIDDIQKQLLECYPELTYEDILLIIDKELNQ